jgi:hypothetical protein
LICLQGSTVLVASGTSGFICAWGDHNGGFAALHETQALCLNLFLITAVIAAQQLSVRARVSPRIAMRGYGPSIPDKTQHPYFLI